jgi:oxaloacetate decarboxylase beta subunit
LILLGAAAQVGIFATYWGALVLGFTPQQAGAIGIIGGADGPTTIFITSALAPELLPAVAVAAYSYMALVPIIQPPIVRLLTTKSERLIRMESPREVTRQERILFPIVAFIITTLLAPKATTLLGMLFFGNLLKESGVTDRLANTAKTAFIDSVTIILGICVGAGASADRFLRAESLKIFALGLTAFIVATACGVLLAKLMNAVSKKPINPIIGAAGVSAVPMAARVANVTGLEEDPTNFLIMHAMSPNVAGVIGSAVAAGVLLSILG